MSNTFYKEPEFDTLQLHAGHVPDNSVRARAPPIYASTSFVFQNTAQVREIMDHKREAFVYSRMGNPTNDVFEKRIAALEGGVAALATSSGQAAQFIAISALAAIGDNIISSTRMYGGTYNQFKFLLKRYGIAVKWVSDTNPESFAALIDEKSKAIYIESLANPDCTVLDIPALAKIAHEHAIPLIVDNTFGIGGYLIKPIQHGADIVVHSATKWIGGHGTTIAGVIVDSGKFDWAKSGKFPDMTEPVEGYHGLKVDEVFGSMSYAAILRLKFQRDLGPALNPFGAFLLLQGLETLSLRGQRHSENALALAQYLETHPKVAWVSYPGLESHGSHQTAQNLFRVKHFGGILCFGVKGDMENTNKFIDSLKLASHLANVGDAKTLVIHPASTIHAQLTEEEQRASGVTLDLIRVSVGLEDIRDIIYDFECALGIAFADDS